MADSKSKKSSNKPDDIESLKSDIASFASSLGLSSSLPSSSSGFNDVDFRKTRPIKPQKKQKQTPIDKSTKSRNLKANEKSNQALSNKPTRTQKPNDHNLRANEKPKPKPPVLSIGNSNIKAKSFDKFKNLSKLPLMKASGFGVWYVDAEEFEAKVVGKEKKVEVRDLGEWKKVVEEKRQLGERLMAQFVQDYESSRGQSGDIKMLAATQRSGTAADKVSAFSVLVGDNPIANLRSLDALLGIQLHELLFFSFCFEYTVFDFGIGIAARLTRI